MNRSTINESIELAKLVFSHFNINLPPFALWSTEQWLDAGSECDEIRDCMLGWDVTDFGSRDFAAIGRTLFTLRNGTLRNEVYPKNYAEKYILDPELQRAPAHFHRSKREDIINRGGGNILIEMCLATPENTRSRESFTVQVDGCTRRLNAGGIVRLRPGQSVCIPPRTIHQFWGEEGTGLKIDGVGYSVSGEVSSVCDDWDDNFFLSDMTRFPEINEDTDRTHYLCHEYPAARRVGSLAAR